jgi:protein-arginine kinase activator protein McsA
VSCENCNKDRDLSLYEKLTTQAKQRMEICKGCPSLNGVYQCRECGCLVPAKVLVPSSVCPSGKW